MSPDCDVTQTQSSNFNFSSNFTDSRLNYSKASHDKSTKSRPRLTKTRRKQVGVSQNASFNTKFDPGFKGFVDSTTPLNSDGKFGVKQSENGTFSFGDSKTEAGSFEFVFRSNKYDFLSNRGRDSSCEELGNVKESRFVFGKSVDQRKQDCKSGKENTVPDTVGKDRMSSVFASNESKVDLEGKPICESEDGFSFTNCGNVNLGFEFKVENARSSSSFVFGASNVGFNTERGNVTNQVSEEMAEGNDILRKHNYKKGTDIKNMYMNSSDSSVFSKKDLVEDLSNEMERLNIHGTSEKWNFNLNSSTNVSDEFVFGRNQGISVSVNENQPSVNTSDRSHSSQNNAGSDSGVREVPLRDQGEKGRMSSTSKVGDLNSSYADYSTANINFSFSSFSFALGTDNITGNAKGKSLRGKRLKKSNGKVKRTLIQDLFGKNDAPVGSSKQKSDSPMFDSPMQFSPYQDSSSSNAPVKGKETVIVKEDNALSKKDAAQHSGDESNTNYDASFRSQDGLSSIKRQYKKKFKSKVGSSKNEQNNNPMKGDSYQSLSGFTIHEVCEHWRIRGNQAYRDGKLSQAEEFYSTGIDSVQRASTTGNAMKPLLLCYSNRAATKMSLGRIREAIDDCTKAAALDPGFLKVTLRAGNCHLILGEVDDAVRCYEKCLESEIGVCLDRRITVEAADGLLKTKRVAEYICKSAKCVEEGTQDAARAALENIAEALSMSPYSEKLFEMKGQALCLLWMYDEVIELCEKSTHISKKNFYAPDEHEAIRGNSHMKLWRWHLQTKCYYHLGKLELALDMIEQGKCLAVSKSGDANQESLISLATSIQELLCFKKSGNEAFHSGRYTEAVEHYTAAISKSAESRPFMAICFCNRAAAYQSMSQIVDAIADCSLAIALDENYRKAISRRATLHEIIRDYKQAANDLQRLISLLENQSQAKTRQHVSQGKSSGGGSIRDLRKARRDISLMEDKAKKEVPLDLYLILGINASDTESDIKKAYRKAALRHHPDKAGQVLVRSDVGKEVGEKIHNDADRLFKVIGEAYAVLSDPSKRSKYDNEEEMRSASCSSYRNGNSSGQPSTSYSTSPYGKGSSYGRQSGYGTERKSRRWHWYDAKPYDSHYY